MQRGIFQFQCSWALFESVELHGEHMTVKPVFIDYEWHLYLPEPFEAIWVDTL